MAKELPVEGRDPLHGIGGRKGQKFLIKLLRKRLREQNEKPRKRKKGKED